MSNARAVAKSSSLFLSFQGLIFEQLTMRLQDNFKPVVEKVKEACKNSGYVVVDHFAFTNRVWMQWSEGCHFCIVGHKKEAHLVALPIESIRLTYPLFESTTGELRAEPVEHTTNAILHPWLKEQLLQILKQCPPAPEVVPEGRRWQEWDSYPAAEQLDRFLPPVRMLLIWDKLAGHKSPRLTHWCAEQGIYSLALS